LDRTIQTPSPNTSPMKTLLFGYGNIDRQDDGVAWHILRGVANHYGVELPSIPDEPNKIISPDLTCTFALQLVPESAEWVAQFEQVFFIDAHTGSIQEPLHFEVLTHQFQSSPFTHHLTPQSCLSLALSLYSAQPKAYLVSVLGYEFGFSQDLSAATQVLVENAIQVIVDKLDIKGDL